MTLAVLSYPAIQGPTEPLNRMRGEVEPWFCPEMPGAACRAAQQRREHDHNHALFPWGSEHWSPCSCYVKEKVLYLWVLPLFKWFVLLPLPGVNFWHFMSCPENLFKFWCTGSDPCHIPASPPRAFLNPLPYPSPLPCPPPPLPCYIGVNRLCVDCGITRKGVWEEKRWWVSCAYNRLAHCCFMVGKLFGSVQRRSWPKSVKLFDDSAHKTHLSSFGGVRYAAARWLTSLNYRNVNSLWIENR